MGQCWRPTVLWLLLWFSQASDSHEDHKFTARWGNPDNGYFPLPWSLEEAGPGSLWHRAGMDTTINTVLLSHIEDPRFFLLFDKQNTIAGVIFGFDKRDVSREMRLDDGHRYSFPNSMFRSANIWDKDLWYSTVLFAHPDVIKTTGRPRLNPATDDVISELYYWVDYEWRAAPHLEHDVTGDLVPQGCYNGMGTHYFYKTDSRTDCSQWQGFFITYHRGLLAGFGVAVLGSFVSTYYTPNYYEYPDFPVVRSMLPNRPACLDKWLPFTGVTSVHVFVTADAAKISCAQSADKSESLPSADHLADSPWYHTWAQWLHSQTSRAHQDSEPSYLTTVVFSAAIIYYYVSYCS